MAESLDDDEVYERLARAMRALGNDTGHTTRGNTALTTARTMLTMLQMALVLAQERATGRLAEQPRSQSDS